CPLMTTRADWALPFDRLAYRLRPPRRGEIVGFVPAGQAGSPVATLLRTEPRLVGRVVGVPGDEVEVRQGQRFPYGPPPQEPSRAARAGIDSGATTPLEGQYFVLGDNRDLPVRDYHGGIVAERDLRGRLTAVGQRTWVFLLDASRC